MSEEHHVRNTEHGERCRRRIRVNGIVQGVGFRPFVYNLAREIGLAGFVANDTEGVIIELEGAREEIDIFILRLRENPPPLSHVVGFDSSEVTVKGDTEFTISRSQRQQLASTLISPDIAVCHDCLRELFDPNDRRYLYPFINCTNCGPRYTIVEGIPYDRPLTSMKRFPMCPDCDREYHDPSDRRFHAQPNACPVCGPKLFLRDSNGEVHTSDPIASVVEQLKQGKVVAVRGVGGFHLAVDAHDERAIERLRNRKGRAEKPFAMMAPDIENIRRYCSVSDDELELLTHHTRPIVLLKKLEDCSLPDSVAPNNKYLGFMLPYSPHQYLLLRDNFDVLVMTSANLAEEPIAIGNDEVMERLNGIADLFLLHDREIIQRCDDSIATVTGGYTHIIRRARGFVPAPVFVGEKTSRNILACGGELKNTIALSRGDQVFLSQHIGDLDSPAAFKFFEDSIEHLGRILEITPQAIAYDLHPEYLSTKWAIRQSLPSVAVQHHHAHLAAVMADNGASEPTIGIILDGTGYGTDGTIWGGEVLIGDAAGFERHAWLETVAMPGGTAAVRQPWRMAISYLYHIYGSGLLDLRLPILGSVDRKTIEIILQMIDKKVNSPATSSCGRLFDGVSALLGIRGEVSFEAQAAIELEMASCRDYQPPSMRFESATASGALPWGEIVQAIIAGLSRGDDVAKLAGEFQVNLAELFVSAAQNARGKSAINRVGLSGGVYQNRYFSEYLVRRLADEKFDILRHRQVPTNDGGLALGQVVASDAMLRRGNEAK
ncbi:MAG: carbamoyltransferase HypF [Candidatus Zixiibacteriota bacterium]